MQPDAVDRLLEALRLRGRRRIGLDSLRDCFARACPELAEQADRREQLARLIVAAVQRRVLSLPRGAASWDRAGSTPLPTFVILDSPRVHRQAHDPGHAWHPLLTFAAQEVNTRRVATLRKINDWLKTDPDLSYTVPIKERSLEIFGDEKRLDALRVGATHFFPDRLSLAQLGCHLCPIPLPFERGPPQARGCPVLIIENNDTWYSFCAWNRTAARFAAVAYAGGGNAKGIAFDELFVDSLLERCGSSELSYFGDLDPRGVRIGVGAARRRIGRQAVPLVPAADYYRWLLDNGTRVPVNTVESVPQVDLEWFSEPLRAPIAELFAAGCRIPQECLGTRVLRRWR